MKEEKPSTRIKHCIVAYAEVINRNLKHLRDRELTTKSLVELQRHFDSLPRSAQTDNICSSIHILLLLNDALPTQLRREDLEAMAKTTTRDADLALIEFEQLVLRVKDIASGTYIADDPLAALRDVLFLMDIIEVSDRKGITKKPGQKAVGSVK